MISCPECQESISDSAFKCPKCGVQLKKLKRGFMAWWLIGGFMAATDGYDKLNSAEQTGAAIGTSIGVMLILGIWVIGDIILGLFVMFTRPKAS
jgi:hypothetical protein